MYPSPISDEIRLEIADELPCLNLLIIKRQSWLDWQWSKRNISRVSTNIAIPNFCNQVLLKELYYLKIMSQGHNSPTLDCPYERSAQY